MRDTKNSHYEEKLLREYVSQKLIFLTTPTDKKSHIKAT